MRGYRCHHLGGLTLEARAWVKDGIEPFWLENVKWISLEHGTIMGETGMQYEDFDLYLTINGQEFKLEGLK